LRDQAEISNINLYPLLDEITQIFSYKNKKYAPLRYYDLKKQFLENELPEKIDEEKYKDKEFHVSSDEELKHMKLSSNSLKSMQDSNLVVIVPTDKISLAVLLYSKDLVKQVKSVKTPMLLIWGFDEEDEIVDEDLIIANEISTKNPVFNSDYNKVSIIDAYGNVQNISKNKKSIIANKVVKIVLEKLLINDRNFN